jgi:hypothetical protein
MAREEILFIFGADIRVKEQAQEAADRNHRNNKVLFLRDVTGREGVIRQGIKPTLWRCGLGNKMKVTGL